MNISNRCQPAIAQTFFMNKIVIISLVYTGFLVAMPFEANALNLQPVSQNLLVKTNLQVAQRPTYQRGYTVHYRSPRDRKWTLEGFHAERPDAQRTVLLGDCNGVVLEPKSGRVQQPNVAGLGIANRRVKQIRIAALSKPIFASYCTILQKNNPGVRSIQALIKENS